MKARINSVNNHLTTSIISNTNLSWNSRLYNVILETAAVTALLDIRLRISLHLLYITQNFYLRESMTSYSCFYCSSCVQQSFFIAKVKFWWNLDGTVTKTVWSKYSVLTFYIYPWKVWSHILSSILLFLLALLLYIYALLHV